MPRPRSVPPTPGPERAQDGRDGPGAGQDAPAAAEALSGAPAAPLIYAKMGTILAALPAIGKDSENTDQHFMFRSHDAVLNAINPLLGEHGIFVVPEVLERIAEKRTTRSGTTMYEVNLLVRYTFLAEDGSWVVASAWGEGTDMGDKSTNKAMTMAFKNVLAQVFAVSTKDTIDADASSPQETRAGIVAPIEDRLRARIAEQTAHLDKTTNAEPGTWARLVADATVAAFGDPYDSAEPASLEEIGKYLKAQIEAKVSEAPEQIDIAPST